MKTKNKVSGYINRSTVAAVLFLSSLLILGAALSSPGGGTQPSGSQATQKPATPVSYERIEPVSVSVIDFSQLAEQDKQANTLQSAKQTAASIEIPPPDFPPPTPTPMPIREQQDFTAMLPATPPNEADGPVVPSQQPSLNFLALADNLAVPPDTMGALLALAMRSGSRSRCST